MIWQQLHITGQSQQQCDDLIALLQACGAVAVTLQDENDQPIFEPNVGQTPLWPQTGIIALFDDKATRAFAQLQLQSTYPNLSVSENELSEEDWERLWMKDFHAMQFGEKLWIIPSHLQAPQPNAVNLWLDPGLAFGTGTHATTALCLQYLDGANIANKTIIDYGCGSGILAIAALKLGATKAIAIDIDPQALQATQSNAERNQIAAASLQTALPEQLPETRVDLILANILLEPLLTLVENFYQHLHPQGEIVLSGILAEQEDIIRKAYEPWFELNNNMQQDGWLCIHGRAKQR